MRHKRTWYLLHDGPRLPPPPTPPSPLPLASHNKPKHQNIAANVEKDLKAETLVAQKATNLLGNVRRVMAALGTLAFIGTFIAGFLIPSQPDPAIMQALGTIQTVVNQTYALLQDVKAELGIIEGTLDEIKKLISKEACATPLQILARDFATIDSLWGEYNDTHLPLVQRKAVLRQALSPGETDAVDDWAKRVVDKVEISMTTIGNVFSGSKEISDDQTVIASCGQYFARQAADSDPFAADDRVASYQLTALTATVLMDVNRAATLLSEAHSWRAQRIYSAALGSFVKTNCSGNITLCPSFGTPDMPIALGELCGRALADPNSALPYGEAWSDCKESERVGTLARDITMRAMELMGAPHSWGDNPGEGVRLVLGTDVVRYGNNSLPFKAPSVWLVPASPGAFDPACTLPNATAEAGCSLVGDFDDTSNSNWMHLKYPLAIDAKYWQASPEPWLAMR